MDDIIDRMIDPPGFDDLYRADADPFEVGSSWYERRKLALTLACLGRERYSLAWDCAAGTGHLAQRLAPRCDRLIASDASVEAVRICADRLSAMTQVRCDLSVLPDWPAEAESADLTVVAEVLFYLADADRRRTLAALAGQAGELLAVHWRHHPHDHLSGAEAHAELGVVLDRAGWTSLVEHDDADFVVATWSSPGTP